MRGWASNHGGWVGPRGGWPLSCSPGVRAECPEIALGAPGQTSLETHPSAMLNPGVRKILVGAPNFPAALVLTGRER